MPPRVSLAREVTRLSSGLRHRVRASCRPGVSGPTERCCSPLQQLRGRRGGQLRSRALDEAVRSRAAQVVGDELRMQDHVAVDQHDVLGRVARRSRDCASGPGESPGLPARRARPAGQPRRQRSTTARVAGPEPSSAMIDFVRQLRLPRDARERELQGLGPVVRRDDQAGAHDRDPFRATCRACRVIALAKACAHQAAATKRWRRRRPSRRANACRHVRLRVDGANR